MGKNKTKAKCKAENLTEALEKQYPSLDSSLITALLSEIDVKQENQLKQLHETLSSLCTPVDDAQSLSSAMEMASLTSGSVSDPFNDSSSSPTSSSTTSSLASFSTPLGFLQNLFPHLESSTLQSALDEHGPDNVDLIVDILLSDDFIREMQERGELVDSTNQTFSPNPNEEWTSIEEWTEFTKIERSTPPSPTASRKPKAKAKQTALVIGDVRHRHLAPPRSASAPSAPVVDPWTYIDSVATRLNSILPNVATSVFSSAFHNPEYSTPATAIRSTLAKLGNTHTVDDFALAALLSLLDAEPEEIPDANLCLRATASQPDDAYHLIEILREVDEKVPVVAHYTTSPVTSPKKNLPSAPPDIPLPTRRKSIASSSTVKSPLTSPVKSAWGTAPTRAKSASVSYSQAASVPGSSAWQTVTRTNTTEHRSEINENDPEACMEEAMYWKEKRHAALKQASELYTRHKHEYGGEAALYYSNQAKDYNAKEREWRLKAAKAGVKAKQDKSSNNAIDLHGLTVHESLAVVKESVNTWWSSAGSGSTPSTPLQIIVGVGRHSKGNIPVIAPAVMKLLERDGWRAHKREGTVYVTGVVKR